MGKLVLKNCDIVVNGIDFSDHISHVEIMMKKASIDTTNFSGGGKEVTPGLREDEISIEFQQDFNAASVDATLYPLYDQELEFVCVIKPTASAVSTTNPSFTATCRLLEYQPLSGKPGDLSQTKVKLNAQRQGVVRAVS